MVKIKLVLFLHCPTAILLLRVLKYQELLTPGKSSDVYQVSVHFFGLMVWGIYTSTTPFHRAENLCVPELVFLLHLILKVLSRKWVSRKFLNAEVEDTKRDAQSNIHNGYHQFHGSNYKISVLFIPVDNWASPIQPDILLTSLKIWSMNWIHRRLFYLRLTAANMKSAYVFLINEHTHLLCYWLCCLCNTALICD